MLFLTLLRSWLLCLCCFQQGICRIPNSFLAGCLYDSFLLDWAPKLSRTNLSHTDEHAITKHVLFTHTDRCSGGNSGLREQTMTLPVVDNHLHLLSHGLLLPGLKMNGGGGGGSTLVPHPQDLQKMWPLTLKLSWVSRVRVVVNTMGWISISTSLLLQWLHSQTCVFRSISLLKRICMWH